MSRRYQGGFVTASYNGLQVPNAPTIGTATAGNATASVTFTAPSNVGGGAITGYTVISSPGSITGTGSSSPITVSGLSNGTAYTFTVVATNAYGTGPASAASNSATPAAASVTWGTPVNFYAGVINYPIGVSLQDSGKVALVYQDESSGGPDDLTRCIIGTISGTSISFGTPVSINTHGISSDAYGITYDSTNARIVWAYREPTNGYGATKAASVSGTVPTWGSQYVFNSGTTRWISLAYSTSASKFVVSYQNNPDSYNGTSIVGTVSGTAVSYGSPTVFDTGSITATASCYDSTNNAIGVLYNDVSTGYAGVVKGTISGTGISFSSASTFDSTTGVPQIQFANQLSFNGTEGKAVGLSWNYTPSNFFITATVSFSGSVPVVGTKVTTSGPSTQTMTSANASNFVAAGYNDASPVGYSTRKGTISGSTVSYAGTELIGATSNGGYIFYDSVSGKLVYVYKNASNNHGYAVVGTLG